MSSDSEDDSLLVKVCQLVTTGMDSVLTKYPSLWGLTDFPERSSFNFQKRTDQVVKNSDQNVNYPAASLDAITIDDFQSHFLMSRQSFAELMKKITRISLIRNLKNKLMFTIWMLRTQESYDAVGCRFNLSKSTGHQAFNEVVDAIVALFAEYVKMPPENEHQEISQFFKAKTGGFIPGIIGAIDACHIQIKQPREDSKDYRNEQMTYSIVLQAVCDHRKVFTDVFVGSPGGLSDTAVFKDSNLYKNINKIIPGEYHLVGDSDYPLMKNLVTTFQETDDLSEEKARFNDILNRAAITVKKALKLLNERFSKLNYVDVVNIDFANKIVCSCVTLHNHIQMYDPCEDDNEYIESSSSQKTEETFDDLPDVDHRQEQSKAGYFKRNYLMTLCD